jgi:hypothetical protein
MEEREGKDEFVVRDRRRFTTEGDSGSAKSTSEETKQTAEETPNTQAASAQYMEEDKEQSQPNERDESRTQEPPAPLDFMTFVLSLANSALFQLGLLKLPEGESHKDLVAAKQTIDLLAILEDKTKGNLTEKEAQILKDTLFQLRMAFVEVSK